MTRKHSSKKKDANTRIHRSDEFKAEALKLAEAIGVSAAAHELSINTNQIYAWRRKQAEQSSRSQREDQLATEVARLKRELARSQEENEILKKATAYFAKAHR